MEKRRLASDVEKEEHDLVLEVCSLERRSVAGFVRLATLKMANQILKRKLDEKNTNGKTRKRNVDGTGGF